MTVELACLACQIGCDATKPGVVEFDNCPVLHYRAEESVAQLFEEEMTRYGSAIVTGDDDVAPTLQELPCRRLFQP